MLGDRTELAGLFEDTRLASFEITTQTGSARFPSIRAMVEADLRGWLPVMGVVLEEEQIERILAQAESALAGYASTEGEVVLDAPAHIIAATRP